MRNIIALSLAMLMIVCAASEAASAQPADRKPIQVFLLAGQSNMEGQGVVAMDDPKNYNGGKGNLLWSMKHSRSAAAMKHLKDAKGQWVVREDVKVWFKGRSGIAKGGLTIGFTGYGGKSHMGPELQFGHVIGDHLDEPVLLIKTAWGGKSLYKDFRPPSAGGQVGPYYTQMLAEIREALADIKSLFPGRESHAYEIAGFVWFQGWNDMCTREAIPQYERNLIHLVTDIRREFKRPNLPVVIGELGNGGAKASGNMAAIRKAQQDAAGKLENARFVVTHHSARPAALSPNVGHGHHWFGNAESYFLVGDALGKGMKELLSVSSAGQLLARARGAYAWFDRVKLAKALAGKGVANAASLDGALGAEHWHVRHCAVMAIRELARDGGSRPALKLLVPRLGRLLITDSHHGVRVEAAECLAALGEDGKGAQRVLALAALNDDEDWVKASAAKALTAVKADIDVMLPVVEAMIRSTDKLARGEGVSRARALFNEKVDITPLVPALKDVFRKPIYDANYSAVTRVPAMDLLGKLKVDTRELVPFIMKDLATTWKQFDNGYHPYQKITLAMLGRMGASAEAAAPMLKEVIADPPQFGCAPSHPDYKRFISISQESIRQIRADLAGKRGRQ